jgi:hypothetical protein
MGVIRGIYPFAGEIPAVGNTLPGLSVTVVGGDTGTIEYIIHNNTGQDIPVSLTLLPVPLTQVSSNVNLGPVKLTVPPSPSSKDPGRLLSCFRPQHLQDGLGTTSVFPLPGGVYNAFLELVEHDVTYEVGFNVVVNPQPASPGSNNIGVRPGLWKDIK